MWTNEDYVRDDKIERIYDVIADKKIRYVCNNCGRKYQEKWDCVKCVRDFSFSCNEEIIIKPVLLWDVIQYANIIISENSEKEDYTDEIENVEKDILGLYRFYTKPIEEQRDDCIDYVYSLLETTQPTT